MPSYVAAKIWIGGKFDFVKENYEYVKHYEYVSGEVYVKLCLWVHTLNVNELRRKIMTYMTHMCNKSTKHFSLWYKRKEMNLTIERMRVKIQDDIDTIADGRDTYNGADIYMIMETKSSTKPITLTRPTTLSRPGALDSLKTEKATPEKKPHLSPHKKKALGLLLICLIQM